MQSHCDDEYSECSEPIRDTKLQLEDNNMDDSQDIRHQVDFDNDSEQVAEEVALIELFKLCINVILLTKESRQLAKGSNNWFLLLSSPARAACLHGREGFLSVQLVQLPDSLLSHWRRLQ